MNTIYLLLPVALLLGAVGLVLMIWAVKNGQFEDLEGPAHRILYEDDGEMVPGGKPPGPVPSAPEPPAGIPG